MGNVLVDEASLKAIGNSIRGKNGSTDKYKPAEMATAIDAIESGGGMNMANYASDIQFTSDDWATSDTVVLDMPNLSTMQSLFHNMDFLKIKHLTINSNTPVTNCQYAFRGSKNGGVLETVVLNIDTSKCSTFSQMFFKYNLKRVEGNPFDFSGATTIGRVFAYTYIVEYFRVVPKSIKINADFGHCTMIDDDTIQSIIDGLADLTGGTAQTITLHANVKARLTDTQRATITGKNWTIA